VRAIDRYVAPAQHALALLGDRRLEDLLARAAHRWPRRQEHLADREPAALGEVEPEPLPLGAEEALGQLDQDPRAVAGPGIRAGLTIPEVENVDVYPLMTELLGLRPAAGIDGRGGRIAAMLK